MNSESVSRESHQSYSRETYVSLTMKMTSKVQDEITSPFPNFNREAGQTANFNGAALEVWEGINNSQGWTLTLKWLDHLFQYVILFPNVVQQKSFIFIWNWSNKLNV